MLLAACSCAGCYGRTRKVSAARCCLSSVRDSLAGTTTRPEFNLTLLTGYPGPAVEMDYELKQSILPAANLQQNFPQSTMVYFQFVFAAITLVLIAGSYLCRMNFFAWMLFVPLWLTFSYSIGAFSLWGGGFLFQKGVIDYSGGYVPHNRQFQRHSVLTVRIVMSSTYLREQQAS